MYVNYVNDKQKSHICYSEILEEDLYSKVEKRNWEEEQEMLKKQRGTPSKTVEQ